MARFKLSPITQEEQSLVAKIVAKQVYYANVSEKQGAELRKLWPDPLDAARNIKPTPFEALPVDSVKRAERLLKAEAVCKAAADAKTIEERLAIMSSALIIIVAITTDEFAALPPHLRLHAMIMYNESEFYRDPDELAKEKAREEMYGKIPEPTPIPYIPASSPGLEPLSRPDKFTSETITSSQIDSILANGQAWLGQLFLLPEDGEEDESRSGFMMRLVEVGASFRNGKWFEVQYEWESFADRVDAEGLEAMLQGAQIVMETSKL